MRIHIYPPCSKSGFDIELTANTLAKSVYLSLPNLDDNFSDNFFDLLPGRKRED